MSDTERSEGGQDFEDPEEELDDEQKALLHFGKYCETRRALPWEQWTFREKAHYYIDRIFLTFLVIFVLGVLGECVYKMCYLTNVNKIVGSAADSVISLFNWLSIQERQEELLEL